MINQKMKKRKVILGSFALMLFSVSLVMAFGVSADFNDGRPVKMYPGETQTITFDLQNLNSAEDYTFKAEITRDDDIATLVHEEPIYLVPANTASTEVPIKITIPSDAKIGDTYLIDASFNQVSESSEGGMVTLIGGMNYKIGVLVTSREESSFYSVSEPVVTPTAIEKDNTLMYVIVAIVIIVVILYFVTKKKK